MTLLLVQGPLKSNGDSPETFSLAEPLALVDLKQHLRIEHTLDDLYLDTLIGAARQQVEETECGIQLLTATYELQMDNFLEATKSIRVPRPPFGELLSLKYIDGDGVLQTMSDSTSSPPVTSAIYTVDPKSSHAPERAEVYLAYDQSWPSTRAEKNAVRIRYKCGWGATPDTVPAAIRQWMMIAAATMYEHREREITGTIISEMKFVDGLLDPFRAKVFHR